MKGTTRNNIAESNKLIAEFIGAFGGKPITDSLASNLGYNTSWDRLMPIVHKCLSIAHEEMLNEWENSFADVFLTASIDIMYKEVVAFIQWYNKNKQR